MGQTLKKPESKLFWATVRLWENHADAVIGDIVKYVGKVKTPKYRKYTEFDAEDNLITLSDLIYAVRNIDQHSGLLSSVIMDYDSPNFARKQRLFVNKIGKEAPKIIYQNNINSSIHKFFEEIGITKNEGSYRDDLYRIDDIANKSYEIKHALQKAREINNEVGNFNNSLKKKNVKALFLESIIEMEEEHIPEPEHPYQGRIPGIDTNEGHILRD